ncbi:glycosyl transferase [Diplonema papillatum]|nr:glycosyl transferase [Diplonema papillatum]
MVRQDATRASNWCLLAAWLCTTCAIYAEFQTLAATEVRQQERRTDATELRRAAAGGGGGGGGGAGRLLVIEHGGEVWGDRRRTDPFDLSACGRRYAVSVVPARDPRLDAQFLRGFDFVSTVSAAVLFDGTRNLSTLLSDLLRGIDGPVDGSGCAEGVGAGAPLLVAGCTVLAQDGTVFASGYEVARNASGADAIVPRLRGEEAGYRAVAGGACAAAFLVNADCMAFRNAAWGPAGGVAAAGRMSDAFHAALRAAPEVRVLGREAQVTVRQHMAVLRGHRDALLRLNLHVGKLRRVSAGLRGALDAAIGALGSIVAVCSNYSDPGDPPSWGWQRSLLDGSRRADQSFFDRVLPLLKGGDGEAAAVPLLAALTARMLSEQPRHASWRRRSATDWASAAFAFTAGVSSQAPGAVGIVGRATAALEWGKLGSYKVSPRGHPAAQSIAAPSLAPDAMARFRRQLLPAAFLAGRAPDPAVVVVWTLPCCFCCGFVNEAFSIMRGLLSLGVDVRLATPIEDCLCRSVPEHLTRQLEAIRISGASAELLARGKPGGGGEGKRVLLVQHGVPFEFSEMRERAGIRNCSGMKVVSRAMYEFTVMPPDHAYYINMLSDETWTPSAFGRRIMAGNVTVPVRVVPESVDTDAFHNEPGAPTFATLPPPGVRGSALRWGRAPAAGAFRFLSVFKWELRKGWDVLVAAFVAAFRGRADVSLWVSTIPHLDPEAQRQKIESGVTAAVAQALSTLQLAPSDVPPICIMHAELASGDVPKLYRSVDAFVLPTRGEGWGLPIMQALATGLPTVATGWSGQMDFLTAENSFLVDYREEEVPRDSSYTWSVGNNWAEPSREHLAQLMRRVIDDPAEAARRGANGRRDVETRFSLLPVADAWRREIDRIMR